MPTAAMIAAPKAPSSSAPDSSSGNPIADAEDVEPGSTAGGPAGETRGSRLPATHQQMIDMAAVLESHAFIDGAHHLGETVP